MFEGMAAGRRAVAAADAAHAWVGQAQRALLRAIAEVERTDGWRGEGARDLPHWVSMRYGISAWKATRWVGAARALPFLPRISAALCSGGLGIDKMLELCRFATPESEERLVRWARDVSVATVRHRGDLAARASREELVQAERNRQLDWWYHDEGRRFGMFADLPAAQGAVVEKALERALERVPTMPGEDEPYLGVPARRADALVAICSATLAADPDPDRATVVVHLQADGAEIEDGPAVVPEVAERLSCDARVQVVAEDSGGDVLAVRTLSRVPPAWMLRQLRHRDRGCRFPGCGTRAFTHAHHIVWWGKGGRTELPNLVLVCSFHHRLVHEHGWRVRREDRPVRWFRPDGTRYRAGPSPWARRDDELDDGTVLTAVG